MTWRDSRRNLRWVFSGAVFLLAVLQVSVSAQTEDDPDLRRPSDAVKVDLEVELDGEQATFSWAFGGEVENATCTLDPDGDDILDLTVANCEEQREVDFLYDEPGVYFAEILVRTRDGRSGRGVERVEVE